MPFVECLYVCCVVVFVGVVCCCCCCVRCLCVCMFVCLFVCFCVFLLLVLLCVVLLLLLLCVFVFCGFAVCLQPLRELRSSSKLIFPKIQLSMDFLGFENFQIFTELPTMSRNSLRLGLRGWLLVESAKLLTLIPNVMVSGPRSEIWKKWYLFFQRQGF